MTISNLNTVPIPPPNERLNFPLSLVKGVKDNSIIRKITFHEQMERMTTNEDLKNETEKARGMKDDPKAYKEIKESKIGFISGILEKRNDNSIIEYSPLMFFDVDGLKDSFAVELLLDECKTIPEVFTAFPSFGGCGLRIGIIAEYYPDIRKTVYKEICKYLNTKLSLNSKNKEKVDTSTSNPSRLFFENYVPEELFYLNLKSDVFSLPSLPTKTISKTTKKTTTSKNKNTISQSDKIRVCEIMARCKNSADGRNNFTYLLALTLFENGISKSNVIKSCLALNEEDFTEAEIKKTVSSAEKKFTLKFDDTKRMAWIGKVVRNPSNKISIDDLSFLKSLTEESTPEEKEPKIEEVIEDVNNILEEIKGLSLVGSTKIEQVINFANDNLNVRRNLISLDIENKNRNGKWELLNESDIEIKLLMLGMKGVKEPLGAFLGSTLIKEYNPFKDYFENLPKWNENDKDYITKLANYVNAKDQEWFNYQFKKMLVRTLACGLGIIPFNKHCFTLVGKQNDGKTSFLRFLCPPQLSAYIKDNPFFGNKDGLLTLVQNLFINLDELATISKYDINQIKKIFTMDGVKERLPYARKPERFQRRASFLGSTNSGEFLTDSTGNVRWLVFEIDGIYHDNGGKNGYNKNIDIDKVWGQAYALLKSGFDFKLSKEDIAKSEVNNKNFEVTTIEAELIQEKYLPSDKKNKDASFVLTKDIHEWMKIKIPKITARSIGIAMKRLGFEKDQKFFKEKDGRIVNYQMKGYYVIDLKANQAY